MKKFLEKIIFYFKERRRKRHMARFYSLYTSTPDITIMTMMGPITYKGRNKIGKQ